jgi:hypothetical protein
MPRRRNPLKFEPPIVIKLTSRPRRADPFKSDDDLRLALMRWQAGYKLGADVQEMINFRLAELLDENRPPPMRRALKDVAALISKGGGWSEYQACKEVARVRGLNFESLQRTWRKKKLPAKPRTKPP